MNKFKNIILSVFLLVFIKSNVKAQTDSVLHLLQIDTNYTYFNFYSNATALQFKNALEKATQQKTVIFHFGGSHIQAEMPTTVARKKLNDVFGDAGRGMIFPYTIANTYCSINYSVKHTGKWTYGKSFQVPPPIPLGICGMAVSTNDSVANMEFTFKQQLTKNEYRLTFLFDIDTLTPSIKISIDSVIYLWKKSDLQKYLNTNHLVINHTGTMQQIKIEVGEKKTIETRFNFYGINVEHENKPGIVYHSLGVGAAPFRSILNIEKLEAHSAILKPDIVILDFGTNDILYKDAVEETLSSQIEDAIKRFRKINPDVVLILTATQDLYYKKKHITATVDFRNLVDSLAKKNDCLFWNWFDLSGGIGTITKWHESGYAKKDGIHLTQPGYQIKGELLARTFINTYQLINYHPTLNQYQTALKNYPKDPGLTKSDTTITLAKNQLIHVVNKGETLNSISKKYGITMNQLKKQNNLTRSKIATGDTLFIKKPK